MKTDHDLLAEFIDHLLAAAGDDTRLRAALAELGKRSFRPKGTPRPLSQAEYDATLAKMKAEIPAYLCALRQQPPGGFPKN